MWRDPNINQRGGGGDRFKTGVMRKSSGMTAASSGLMSGSGSDNRGSDSRGNTDMALSSSSSLPQSHSQGHLQGLGQLQSIPLPPGLSATATSTSTATGGGGGAVVVGGRGLGMGQPPQGTSNCRSLYDSDLLLL